MKRRVARHVNRVQNRAAEFERLFIEALCNAGVQAVSDFKIKTKNQFLILDTYISSPQRAIVEIKMLSDNSSPRLIDKAQRFLAVSREAFDQQVTCFLVIVKERDCPSKLLSSEEWMTIIEVSGSNAVANAAAQIRDQLYTSIPAERMLQLSPAVIMDALPEAGLLSDVLVNFRTRISPDAFEVLRSEAASFHREYSSAHYTTSALCVGRMLEFTIYTLAKAWDVPINKRSIGLLDDLDQRYKVLSNRIIEYAYEDCEAQKNMLWDKLKKEILNFNGTVTNAAMSLNDNHEKIYTDFPINIEAIIRGVIKKYGRIGTVRDETKFLLEGKIREVMDIRNRAAHADTSGSRTDYGQHQIDQMIDSLRSVLFSLGNMADAIDRDVLDFNDGQ
jgi:hypothetical protein